MKQTMAKFMHAGKVVYGKFMGNRGPKVTLEVQIHGRTLQMDVPRANVLEWHVSEPERQERRHKGGKGPLMNIGNPNAASSDKPYQGWGERLTQEELDKVNAKRTGIILKAHDWFGGWNNPAMRPELPEPKIGQTKTTDNGCRSELRRGLITPPKSKTMTRSEIAGIQRSAILATMPENVRFDFLERARERRERVTQARRKWIRAQLMKALRAAPWKGE